MCSPEYREQLYMMRGEFGLSLIINPEREAAKGDFPSSAITGLLKARKHSQKAV